MRSDELSAPRGSRLKATRHATSSEPTIAKYGTRNISALVSASQLCRSNGRRSQTNLQVLRVTRLDRNGLSNATIETMVNIMKRSAPTNTRNFLSTIVSILSVLGVLGPVSYAQNEVKRVTTPAGLLVVRQGTADECRAPDGKSYDCQVLDLNGQVVFHEAYVNIVGVVPNSTTPQLVIASGWIGGNCCNPVDHILDFTKSPPIFVKEIPYYADWNKDAKLSAYSGGITYQGYSDEQSSLGEPIWQVYRYKYGSGSVEIIRSTVQYNFEPLKAKKYPSDLLNDPVRREPLLKVIGQSQFKSFRQNIAVQSPIDIVADRFVVGSGCAPHSCGTDEAIFVMDMVTSDAWAISFTTDYTVNPAQRNVKLWGNTLTADSAAKAILTRWMTERGLSWTSAATVPYTAPLDQSAVSAPGKHTEVPLSKSGGIFTVPVLINGIIPLNFMVDSGASDVSIPADVVLTLMRTGTLTDADFIGSSEYRMADGSIVPSTTFRLRTIKVGDRVIENVVASMTGVEGSLLLGQSFLGRFQRWSINNSRQALELE